MRTLNKLLACAMALVVPLSTWAQTEVEPNNTSGTATLLTYNTAMTGRMGVCSPTDNSVDYFKIVNLPQGQMRFQSTISNTGPANLAVTIQVRNSGTSVIGTYTLTAGANGSPVNDSFVFPCQGGTGNYYFSLVNPSTTYCTNYTFTVDVLAPFFANDPEPNNGGSSSVPVAVNTWQQGQANFYYGDNADYYRLDLPTNGVLNIDWEAEHAGATTGSTATITLRNSSTAVIQAWTVPVGANSIPAADLKSISCRSNTGYYILSVTTGICGTSYRFRYNVTAPVFANDPEPNNGTTITPTPVAHNAIQEGQINFLTYVDNADYFVLTLPTDGVLAVTMEMEHAGTDAAATATVSLRQTGSSVLNTYTVPVGANSTPTTTVITRNCLGNTNIYYISIASNICGASYRFSYNVTPPVFGNDTEPNNTQFTTPWVNLNDSSVTGHMEFYYDGGVDGYKFSHPGGHLFWDMSAEHAGTTPGTLIASFRNASYHNVLAADTIVVGANHVPVRTVKDLGVVAAQSIRVYYSTPTCGVSYRWNCADSDGDGVCDGADLCTNTPSGEGVNSDGCSCSQVIVSDGDACTLDACLNGTVMHTYQDADGDGTCDVNDGCPNDANKTAPGACGCGVADTDSDSDGLADCNDNCPNYPGQIGSSCDDGDVNTTGDVVTGTCTCAGSATPCPDDGDACTLEIVVAGTCTHQPLPDADADGTCDLNDGCPNDPNKIAPGTCGCGVADADTDSDGTADCNDGCPNDANKTAPGTCGCGVADTDSDGDATADCIDGCPADPNKTAPGICGCGLADTDSDGDGVADCNDSCPNTPGVIGSTCNDNNANTENDVLDPNCQCVGTPIGTNCTQNAVTLTLNTDANASQTTWDIVNIGGGPALCSGGGYADNTTITVDCCLPSDCYTLRVFDSYGDGINPGGYVLRDANGKRIIDNANNGLGFTTLSQVSSYPFCVPIGTDELVSGSCDMENALTLTVLQAAVNPAVTAQYGVSNATSGYQFWVYNPNGGFSRRIFLSHAIPGTGAPVGTPAGQKAAYFQLSSMSSSPTIPLYVMLNVRVRSRVNGVYAEFGPACRLKIDPSANCAATQLTTTTDPVVSCGATGLGYGSTIYAAPVLGATDYQFEFSKPGYLRRIRSSSHQQTLGFVANPLVMNNCYNVRVRVSMDGAETYCSYGASCTITLGTAFCAPAMAPAPEDRADFLSEARLAIFPNPSPDGQVTITLEGLALEDGTSATIQVYDMLGQPIRTEQTSVSLGRINQAIDLGTALKPGVYMVNVIAGDQRFTQRMIRN